MLYHVRISTKSSPTDDETKLGFSREQLFTEVLLPLAGGQAITVNGRTITAADVSRLRVSRSAESVAHLRDHVKAVQRNSPVLVFGGPSIDWRVADCVEDCSDEVLKEAQQMTANSPSSPSPPPQQQLSSPQLADTRAVFVVHGRNMRIREAVFTFLRALDLKPIEWSTAREATGEASPYVGDILERGFGIAQAAVVLLSGDDEARLRPELCTDADGEDERSFQVQPRPNVLLEAGIALGKYPDRTILIEFGKLRPISDIAGRYVVRCDGSPKSRRDIVSRLRTARCAVDDRGSDWLTAGDLAALPDVKLPSADVQSVEVVASLSQDERELLLLMLYSAQECFDCTVGPQARHIEVGGHALYDPSDVEVALGFAVALDRLKRGLFCRSISSDRGCVRNRLTASGQAAAEQLRDEGRKPSKKKWPPGIAHLRIRSGW